MLRRIVAPVLVFGLVALACGGDSTPPQAESAAPSSSTSSATSTTTSSTTSTTTTTSTTSSTTSTTTTTTTTTVPVDPDLVGVYNACSPPVGSLVVHDRQSVLLVDPTEEPARVVEAYGFVGDHLILSARLASDGSLVVEITDDVDLGDPPSGHNVQQHWCDGWGLRLIDDAVLFDVAEFGGVESALVGEVWDGTTFEEGQLLAVPLDGRPPIAFGTAFAPEYGVGSIDVFDGVAAVSAFADLTELVTYTDIEANPITLPSPTDDLPYGEAPFVHLASFSPDGSELAWIEGPEHYFDVDAGTETWHGEWRIRSLDVRTGEERLSWPFGFPNEDPFAQLVTGLVHAGDRLYVSRAQVHDGVLFDIEMLMLDLTTEEPELRELLVFGVVADVVT